MADLLSVDLTARTGTCQVCGTEGYTENANLSGEYLRDLDDFLEMCKSCHATYDERERNFARPVVS